MNRAFTLLELLVVVAIIGLFASIVLASLQSARFKSEDAAIKGNLHSIRNEAELYYTAKGNYGPALAATGACPVVGTTIFNENVNIKAAIAAAQSASGAAPICATLPTSGDATQWAVSVSLKYDTPNHWCVDYTGAARRTPGAIVTAACP